MREGREQEQPAAAEDERAPAGDPAVTEGEPAPPDADLGPEGTEPTAGSPGPTPVRGQAGL